MSLHYQTEYRLGSRGRICRSYTGFQAFVAICFDLVFGLLFELFTTAISLAIRVVILAVQLVVQMLRINWKILVAAMTLLVSVLTLPFAMIHEAANRLRSRRQPDETDPQPWPTSTGKPEWALSREV
jgi:hypothetical protein